MSRRPTRQKELSNGGMMKSLIKAETRKLLTTRTAYGLLAGMVLLAGPGIILAGQNSISELSKPLEDQVWFFIAAGFTRLLVVVLGIRAVTDEFRHGTIVPSALASPARSRLLMAKAITAGATGLLFTVIAEAVMVAFAAFYITANGAELAITSDTARALFGTGLAGLLWAMVGVAIGAILRHQIPAIVGSLLWLMPGSGLEEMVGNQLGTLGGYLPGNQGLALALAPTGRVVWMSALVLAAYAGALMTAGTLVMRSRDITT